MVCYGARCYREVLSHFRVLSEAVRPLDIGRLGQEVSGGWIGRDAHPHPPRSAARAGHRAAAISYGEAGCPSVLGQWGPQGEVGRIWESAFRGKNGNNYHLLNLTSRF